MSIIGINEPSIFIPHVFSNTSDQVEDVFVTLFGRTNIDRVDIVRHSEDVCRAYVHFTSWPNTPEGRKLREKLLSGETVKVVYSEPRFWKCVASNVSKPRQEQSTPRGPYIEVDDMMVNCVDPRSVRTHSQQPRHQQHQRTHNQYQSSPQHHHQHHQNQYTYESDRVYGGKQHFDNRNAPMRRVAFHSGGGYQEQPPREQRRHQIKPAKNFKNKKWVRSDIDGEDKQEGTVTQSDDTKVTTEPDDVDDE
jgi:hypothetical protein